MKSSKATSKNNAARARNTRGKKSAFISKKEETETTPPVSMKEDDSLQAMHSKIQRQMDEESAPAMQTQPEDNQEMVQKQELNDDLQQAPEDETK